MKLNKEGKRELRLSIEQELKEVPEGQRVHLDKKLLEELLFDTYIEEFGPNLGEGKLIGKKVTVKYLVWSDLFLSKIDLSEVSFDDVMWDVTYNANNFFVTGTENRYVKNKINGISLINTNAKIDFSKSFSGKYYEYGVELGFSNCYFTQTDLSNNLIDCNCSIDNCGFDNTGLKINLKSKNQIRIYFSDLTGLNFSAYTVDESFFNKYFEVGKPIAYECCLANTGLKIITTTVPRDTYSKYKKMSNMLESERKKTEEDIKDYYSILYNMDLMSKSIKNEYLGGCYLNGKQILSKQQSKELARVKREEYEKMKADLIASTTQSINQQISKTRKK